MYVLLLEIGLLQLDTILDVRVLHQKPMHLVLELADTALLCG
jgi:hypothetical protein